MEYIGFTTKYYTLWEVEYNGNKCSYVYRQNLSMNFEKAKAKRPNALIDLSLRGHSSFEINIPTFIFGKYKGQQINQCEDYDYLKWYHNVSKSDYIKRVIRPILLKRGYKLWNGICLFNEKEYEYQLFLEKKFPQFNEKIENHEKFSFVVKKGLKDVEIMGDAFKRMEIPFCVLNFPTDAVVPMGKTITIDEYECELIDPMKYEFMVYKFSVR